MVPAGEHWKKLAIALCKAFHTPGALERMVKFQFDLDLAMTLLLAATSSSRSTH